MPLMDISKPEVIKFLIESHEKTTKLRIRWNVLHKAQLENAAVLTRPEKGLTEQDVTKISIVEGMPTISREHKFAGYNRKRTPLIDGVHIPALKDLRKGHSIPEVGLGDPKEDPRLAGPPTHHDPEPIMRPIKPEHTELLYKDDFGRKEYLKVRNRELPEKKFYFQECGGWSYGWRMKDSMFGWQKGPDRARVCCLTHGTKSRTGPQPDPDHYKDADIPSPIACKCSL